MAWLDATFLSGGSVVVPRMHLQVPGFRTARAGDCGQAARGAFVLVWACWRVGDCLRAGMGKWAQSAHAAPKRVGVNDECWRGSTLPHGRVCVHTLGCVRSGFWLYV